MTRAVSFKESWRIKAISAGIENSDIIIRLHFGDRYMAQIAWEVIREDKCLFVNLDKATTK